MLSSSPGRVSILVCSLALGVVSVPAHAQTSGPERFSNMSIRALLQSDEFLGVSSDEIGKLSLREAEAFTRSLADCTGDILDDTNARGVCTRSQAYFRIVGPSGSALSRLSGAVGFYSVSLQVLDHNRGVRSTEDGTIAARIKVIEETWAHALRSRFAALDAGRP